MLHLLYKWRKVWMLQQLGAAIGWTSGNF